MSGALLDVRGISIAFGGLKAVQNFSLGLPTGCLHGLIGPNGAGKTTVFNLLTGVYEPDEGTITLDGEAMTGLAPHRRAWAGMARTFQNIRLFPHLSVLDNVRIATHLRTRGGIAGSIWRSSGHRGQERAITERARDISCGSLSFLIGSVRMRGICRTAISVALRSPARWRPTRRSCSWMSRRPA
jgi:branched-chain amino acid transport system ATP-binding protein